VTAERETPGLRGGGFPALAAGVSCESKTPCAVTVCGNGSLLIHTTVSPRATLSEAGSNFTPSMTTVCSAACAAVAQARPAATTNHNVDVRVRSTLLELALELLGMVEVRHEGRADLLDQSLELGVL